MLTQTNISTVRPCHEQMMFVKRAEAMRAYGQGLRRMACGPARPGFAVRAGGACLPPRLPPER
jgi:hypothetical protein